MRGIPSALAALALLGIAYQSSRSDRPSPPLAPELAAPRAAATHLAPPAFPGEDGFVSGITNLYLGFRPGRVFRYESRQDEELETEIVEVARDTKTVAGVAATVVRDVVSEDGEVTEETDGCYAQDRAGNVWLLAENAKELRNGVVVSRRGSWRAGAHGARPGIVMRAAPAAGTWSEEEYCPGVAQDVARVVGLSQPVRLAYGSVPRCLVTVEWSRLDRGARALRYYAPGVGLVLETGPRGERAELISIKD